MGSRPYNEHPPWCSAELVAQHFALATTHIADNHNEPIQNAALIFPSCFETKGRNCFVTSQDNTFHCKAPDYNASVTRNLL